MRNALLVSAALLGFSGGAFAQTNSATQNPPSPNASTSMPEPANSLPRGAGTPTGAQAGDNLGGAQGAMPMQAGPKPMVSGGDGMTGMHTMRGQHRMAHSRMAPHGRAMGGKPGTDKNASADEGAAPPTSEYRGGAHVPLSHDASNTTAANTRSEIAPRLPDPGATSNSPEAFLAAAQRALNAGRTGAAQEALERAETRILSRSTDPSMANSPDDSAMVQNIGQARRALASRDIAAARSAIGMAMSGRAGG